MFWILAWTQLGVGPIQSAVTIRLISEEWHMKIIGTIWLEGVVWYLLLFYEELLTLRGMDQYLKYKTVPNIDYLSHVI